MIELKEETWAQLVELSITLIILSFMLYKVFLLKDVIDLASLPALVT